MSTGFVQCCGVNVTLLSDVILMGLKLRGCELLDIFVGLVQVSHYDSIDYSIDFHGWIPKTGYGSCLVSTNYVVHKYHL